MKWIITHMEAEITIDDERGGFKLFYEGDLFTKGKIANMGYFFD